MTRHLLECLSDRKIELRFNIILLKSNIFFSSVQRRNDREEIRRRLAMGPEADDIRIERGRKPSLHTRLQSGL